MDRYYLLLIFLTEWSTLKMSQESLRMLDLFDAQKSGAGPMCLRGTDAVATGRGSLEARWGEC